MLHCSAAAYSPSRVLTFQLNSVHCTKYTHAVFGRPLTLTLLARRSRHFAGTRFKKRGISDQGKVGVVSCLFVFGLTRIEG